MNKITIKTEPAGYCNAEMVNNSTLARHFREILKHQNIVSICTKRIQLNNFKTNKLIDDYSLHGSGIYHINGKNVTRNEAFDYIFNKIWSYESEIVLNE